MTFLPKISYNIHSLHDHSFNTRSTQLVLQHVYDYGWCCVVFYPTETKYPVRSYCFPSLGFYINRTLYSVAIVHTVKVTDAKLKRVLQS